MKHAARTALIVARTGLGLGLLAYVLARTGAVGTLRGLGGATWLLAVLFAQSLFGGGIEAVRLRVLFRAAGLRLGLAGAYRVVLIGSFFNFCIPGGTGGDVVKLYYLAAGNRNRGVEAATVVLVDRIIALTALLVLVLVLAGANARLIGRHSVLTALTITAALGLVAIAIIAACIGSRAIRASRLFGAVLAKLPFRKAIERAADAAHAFRNRKLALLRAGALSFTGHVAAAAMFALIASVVLPAVPPQLVGMLSLMGMVANAIPVTPGGLGVGEAAFDQLFGVVGVTGAAALLIVWRLGLVPFAIVGALTYMAGAGRRIGAGEQRAATTGAEPDLTPVPDRRRDPLAPGTHGLTPGSARP